MVNDSEPDCPLLHVNNLVHKTTIIRYACKVIYLYFISSKLLFQVTFESPPTCSHKQYGDTKGLEPGGSSQGHQ